MRGRLENLYDGHRHRLLACALSVTQCRDLAEDAIHDAFSRLMPMEKAPRNLKAYVFRAVRNAAIDLVRRNNRTVSTVEEYIVDPSNNQRDKAAAKQFQRRLAEALATLSEDERETIVQHLYADLTLREIAEMRERPAGTIATWYRRGIEKLRERLEDES